MNKYIELTNKHPEMKDCFFAFNNEQFAKGLKRFNLKKEDILQGKYGLFGTKEGINKFMSFYDDLAKQIKEECTPQEVYNYEYNNHECEYTGDDTDAMDIVISYFGEDVKVERKR